MHRSPKESTINPIIYLASTWVIPALLAITLHEAAHGYVAKRFGDDTAWQAGRVTFNPLKHVDPFGTIVLPALLLLTRAPFLFGYAKPVPVRFTRLRNPRRDMIWVAAAGPGMNLLMATVAALLLHGVRFLPPVPARWVLDNLAHAIELNVLLAVFNLIPLPPLDGGRVAVGILPNALAAPLARLERYGTAIIIGVLFILPMFAARTGAHLDVFTQIVARPTDAVIKAILFLTGSG
ncbi:MAG TPA: site-2 protease family protein [Steroidobacteraceae bacterium]|nr:site-2 protease family protein [Steroidobacteraceae bacterium]